MSLTETPVPRAEPEAMPENLRSVQPGGGVCYRIELAWGRDGEPARFALAWLMTVGWLHQQGSGPIHRHTSAPEEAALLAELGFEPSGEYEVWLR